MYVESNVGHRLSHIHMRPSVCTLSYSRSIIPGAEEFLKPIIAFPRTPFVVVVFRFVLPGHHLLSAHYYHLRHRIWSTSSDQCKGTCRLQELDGRRHWRRDASRLIVNEVLPSPNWRDDSTEGRDIDATEAVATGIWRNQIIEARLITAAERRLTRAICDARSGTIAYWSHGEVTRHNEDDVSYIAHAHDYVSITSMNTRTLMFSARTYVRTCWCVYRHATLSNKSESRWECICTFSSAALTCVRRVGRRRRWYDRVGRRRWYDRVGRRQRRRGRWDSPWRGTTLEYAAPAGLGAEEATACRIESTLSQSAVEPSRTFSPRERTLHGLYCWSERPTRQAAAAIETRTPSKPRSTCKLFTPSLSHHFLVDFIEDTWHTSPARAGICRRRDAEG